MGDRWSSNDRVPEERLLPDQTGGYEQSGLSLSWGESDLSVIRDSVLIKLD